MLPSAPSPPSWQCLFAANPSPPLLKGERHVFSQMAGGGGEVELSDRARPLLWSPSAMATACAGPVVKARNIGNNCGGTAPPKIVTMLSGGIVAAPTLFSAQRATSHLSRWAPLNSVTVT